MPKLSQLNKAYTHQGLLLW